jgi:hypothetical protein
MTGILAHEDSFNSKISEYHVEMSDKEAEQEEMKEETHELEDDDKDELEESGGEEDE